MATSLRPTGTDLNPFRAEDIALAQRMLDTCDQLDALYEKCVNCNLDVKALQEQCAAYRSFAAAIIKEFGGVANVGVEPR